MFVLFSILCRFLLKLSNNIFPNLQLDYKEPEENDVIDFIFNREDVESVSKIMGSVKTTKTFTALCTARGLGIKSGKVGVESSFVVEVKDRFGNPYVEGTHYCPIQVTIKAPEGRNRTTKTFQ